MARVLLTAFDAYDDWTTNSSWQAVVELTKDLPAEPHLTTRRYPANFAQLRERLQTDVAAAYDVIVLLGQAAETASLRLESVALNIAVDRCESLSGYALASDGPMAYRTPMPLDSYANLLREQAIPAYVSYHAGVYLCNAAFYWAQHLVAQQKLNTQVVLIHVPLNAAQAAESLGGSGTSVAYMETSTVVNGLRVLLDGVSRRPTQPPLA